MMQMQEQTSTDERLMGRFRDTLDEQVFRALAGRYYPQALRIAHDRLGNETAAQDAVQETLIRIVRHRRRYDPTKPFARWFFAILRNVCADLHRKEARHQQALQAFADWTAPPAAESATNRMLDLEVSLSTGEAELLQLRYVDGLSHAEIAGQIGCSLEAAKKRFQRILKRLRQ